MTSQGMIFNKRNIILVSDKQETMADGKTYGGIDKIFEISKYHAAAVMVNGYADFENVPIETLIGEFKIHTNFQRLSTIDEIKIMFIDFLSKNTKPSSVENFLNDLLKDFKINLLEEFRDNGFEKTIEFKQKRDLPSFVKNFPDFDNQFHDIIPADKDKYKYNCIIWEIFSYCLQFEGTGIIFAGFNLKNHYPSFIELNIYCNDGGKIIYEVIDFAEDCHEPFIKVFAINEEAYTFITGVNDEFKDYILNYVAETNESLIDMLKWILKKEDIDDVDKIVDIVKNLLYKEYSRISGDITIFRLGAIEDTSRSIENLPEWLLCLFAELLIRLTAIKQKTTSEIESVSVSSDILILTKINGFKWVKNDERIL